MMDKTRSRKQLPSKFDLHKAIKQQLRRCSVTPGFVVGSVVIFLCYFFIYYFTPVYGDDLCFLKDYPAQTGYDHLTLDGIAAFFNFLWHTENGRLPNLLLMGIYAIALNKLTAALLLGGLATGMTIMLTRMATTISGRKTMTALHLGIVWLLSSLGLSWWSNMFTGALTTNYILPTLMDVGLIALTVSALHHKYSAMQCTAFILYALLCGWMHEGASAIVLAGMGFWIICRGFRVPGAVWWIVVAFAVGFALTLSSPMIWVRFSLEHQQMGEVVSQQQTLAAAPPALDLSIDPTPKIAKALKLALEMIPLPLLLFVATGYAILIPKGRCSLIKLSKRDDVRILTFAMLTGLAMWTVLARHNAGVTWFPQCFALILIASVAFTTITVHTTTKKIAVISIYLLLGIGYAHAAIITADINKEYNRIISLSENSDSGTVFYNLPDRPYFSALRLPPVEIWRCDMHVFAANYYETKIINVVPEALQNFSVEKARPLAGNAGLYEYHGLLVAPSETLIYKRFDMPCEVPMDYCDYVFGFRGESSGYPTQTHRYRFTATDSTQWLYVEPIKPVDATILQAADRY